MCGSDGTGVCGMVQVTGIVEVVVPTDHIMVRRALSSWNNSDDRELKCIRKRYWRGS
jgi:hypothetical protein